jgi:hypothetical protein
MKKLKYSSSQSGSSLIIILVAVALFAALSYVISQQSNSSSSLSNEKIRLIASDILDMGNKLSDSTARLRLRQISNTKISFENSIVAGYTNAACTTDLCKVFTFDGGGKDWETPTPDVNGGVDWGYTGDVAIKNIGSDDADLVAILPELSLDICDRINILIGIYGAGGTPTVIAAVNANKFTGAYAGVPVSITGVDIDGEKSACIQITAANGTAFTGAPLANSYVFYQVLEAR